MNNVLTTNSMQLHSFGLTELNKEELTETKGGFWQFIAGYLVAKLMDVVWNETAASLHRSGPYTYEHNGHAACDNV